ncbi:MAG: hypothetical protein AABX52_00165 [Nanoarchaeota archaeon]
MKEEHTLFTNIYTRDDLICQKYTTGFITSGRSQYGDDVWYISEHAQASETTTIFYMNLLFLTNHRYHVTGVKRAIIGGS